MEYFNDDSIVLKEDIVFDDAVDVFDIPYILDNDSLEPPKFLGEYTSNDVTDWNGGAVHFFLDDARFNAVWSRPEEALKKFKSMGVNTILSPDFSLYTDYPLAMQLWNVYRNRTIGAYWQMHGIDVIPSVAWSDERSYPFAFAGIEEGSIVAISTVGISKINDKKVNLLWYKGLETMINTIKPRAILCYGNLDERHKLLGNFITYPTRWRGILNKKVAKGRAVAKGLFDYDKLK